MGNYFDHFFNKQHFCHKFFMETLLKKFRLSTENGEGRPLIFPQFGQNFSKKIY